MEITIEIDEAWEERLLHMAELMGCEPALAVKRSLALGETIVRHLDKEGASVVLKVPGDESRLNPGVLYGISSGVPPSFGLEHLRRR